jgi:hypothetical protein
MLRTTGAVVAGVVIWFVLLTISDRAMRFAWPEYQAVWSAMAFTLPMMLARLAESTVGLVIAAWATVSIARGARAAPWALGIVMLALFIPVHIGIWSKFPIWYHAYFLGSLLLIPLAVGALTRRDAP